MFTLNNSVSIGDLFTGLSVLVSAGGIAISNAHDRRQRRREQRCDAIIRANEILEGIYGDCMILGEKIAWQQQGVGDYSNREVVDFVFDLQRKIKCLQPGLSAWGDMEVQNSLDDISNWMRDWVAAFAQSLVDGTPPRQFNEVSKEIETLLLRFSRYLRASF